MRSYRNYVIIEVYGESGEANGGIGEVYWKIGTFWGYMAKNWDFREK